LATERRSSGRGRRVGLIQAASAFRDDEGRVCRHLTYSLSLGTFVREVEGIAGREPGGT
jgi:hypothetical protein